MRRFLLVVSVLCLFLLPVAVAGCSGDSAGSSGSGSGDVDAEDVDVDLTRLSETVAAAEFSNILANSGNYIGQTIRVSGEYFSVYINEFGRLAHYVTVMQGDACCPPEGFEFKLTDERVSDGDFPEQNTMIEVTGVLGRYEELGFAFLFLSVDEVIVLG